MQAIRTGFWVIFAVALTIFAAMNFHLVEVHVFPDGGGYKRLEWPLALVIVASFLLGFLPMLLAYRTAKWTAHRKIKQQDDTIAMLRPVNSAAPMAGDPVPTPTQTQTSTPPGPDPIL